MINELTNDQKHAFQYLTEMLMSRDPVECSLTGYSGTGKTTVTGWVCEALAEQDKRVLLSAPTHKAAHVLRGKVPKHTSMTVHKACGLKPDDNTGDLVRSSSRAPIMSKYDVLVVDEASMVGRELYGAITSLCKHYEMPLLWVGDPAQLPPVNEEDAGASLAFSGGNNAHLEEIVRQEGRDSLLKASAYLRDCVNQGAVPDEEILHKLRGNGEILFSTQALWKTHWMAHNRYGDDVKTLAFHNAAVNQVAACVGRAVDEESDDRFPVGCPVEVTRFWNQEVPTSSRGIVTKLGREILECGPLNVACRQTTVKFSGELYTGSVMLYGEDEQKVREAGQIHSQFQKECRAVEAELEGCFDDDRAIELRKERSRLVGEQEKAWKWVKSLRSAYMPLQRSFSSTIHKSQGDTLKTVVVDWSSLQRAQRFKRSTVASLAYVACTRAAERLIINL